MKLLVKQFFSFSVVGAVGTVFHFAVLVLFVQTLGSSAVLGSFAGFVTGAVVNYLLNYYFTFKSESRHRETSVKFFTVAISGLGINTLMMFLMTPWLHYLASQAITTATVLFWNFLCNRFWTFREACLVKQ